MKSIKKTTLLMSLAITLVSCDFSNFCSNPTDDAFNSLELWEISINGDSLALLSEIQSTKYYDYGYPPNKTISKVDLTGNIYYQSTGDSDIHLYKYDIIKSKNELVTVLDRTTSNHERFSKVQFSPDANSILYRDSEGVVFIYDLKNETSSIFANNFDNSLISYLTWFDNENVVYTYTHINTNDNDSTHGMYIKNINKKAHQLNTSANNSLPSISKDSLYLIFHEHVYEDGSNVDKIYRHNLHTKSTEYLSNGVDPDFINSNNYYINFQTFRYNSDMNINNSVGNSINTLKNKTNKHNYDIHLKNELLTSTISLSDQNVNSLILIDTNNFTFNELIESSTFLQTNSNRTDENFTIHSPSFNHAGDKIYFIVNNYYVSDPCKD